MAFLSAVCLFSPLVFAWQTSSGTSFAQGDYRSSTRSPVEGEHRELTDAEVERLRIVWRKPEIKSRYGPPELVISGTLQLQSEDGKQSAPISWVQPISVAIARRPGDPPGMRRGFPEKDFAVENTLVNEKDGWPRDKALKPGEFAAHFELGEIHRAIGEERSFAVAVSLGKIKGKTAHWSSRDDVLKATVAQVAVPGQPRLSKTVQLINSCPGWHATEFDPKVVIRTVNELQSLGRDGALKAFDEYCRLGTSIERFGGTHGRTPEEIDTSDPSCLLYLVELVFGDLRTEVDRQQDVELHKGIPFHREYELVFSRSGPLWDFNEWVERAEKKGKFRSKPLRPPDDPLGAADEYFAELVPRLKAEEPDHLRGNSRKDRLAIQKYLRAQAIRLITSEETIKALPELDVKDASSDARWRKLKDSVAKLNLRWEDKLQEYRPSAK